MEVIETAKRILKCSDYGLCARALQHAREYDPWKVRMLYQAIQSGAIPELVYDFALYLIEQREGNGEALFV